MIYLGDLDMTPRVCFAVQFSEGRPALKFDYPDLYKPRLLTATPAGKHVGEAVIFNNLASQTTLYFYPDLHRLQSFIGFLPLYMRSCLGHVLIVAYSLAQSLMMRLSPESY